MALLKVSGLTKNFGGLCAVSNVNMEINEQELIGLIGPNGAGKTTLFNLLTGVYEPSEGKIELNVDGAMKEIGGMKPYAVTRMGLARTFQNIRLFKNLTALDNVKIAMHKNIKYGTLQAILRTPNYYREEERVEQQAEELLKVVHLYDKRNELASNLPYGEQRRLEIARALATKPKVLFLDEPAAGMNPQETADLTRLIHQIKDDFHLTVILIEHDMSLVMTICERIYVLDYGKCIANGVPEVIKNDKRVIKAYLGRIFKMLKVEKLNVHYGVIHALKDVSMEVKEGEIVSLIGANGAGKTTLLQTISGLLKKTSGEVVFLGKSMNKVSAKNIVKEGITQVPEGRHIFSGMSVYENLLMGAYLRKDKDGIKADLQDIYQRFPILEKRSSQDASTLSGGEQQMLAMGRALMARPKILLLDEPSMGLAPILVKEIFNIIKDINEKGTTVLLVEQNAKMALSIADRAYVMETGNIVMTGTGAELVNSPEIQKAYLGG